MSAFVLHSLLRGLARAEAWRNSVSFNRSFLLLFSEFILQRFLEIVSYRNRTSTSWATERKVVLVHVDNIESLIIMSSVDSVSIMF